MAPATSKTAYVTEYVPSTSTFKDNIFDGKVLFCTGGGSGICKGMVESMMRHGVNATIVGRNLERLGSAAKELSDKTGRKCVPAQADVRSPEQLRSAVETTISQFGRIDFVICGAAGNFLAPIEGVSERGFRTVVEIDTLGTYNTVKATLPYVREQRGAYIMVSATLHYRGTPWQVHVSAAKAGVDAISQVIAVEEGPRGVRSNVIAPGPIRGTEGMDRLGAKATEDEIRAQGLAQVSDVPLQRHGNVGDVANAGVFLFSEAAKWITGQVLQVTIVGPALSSATNHASLDFPRTPTGRVYHLGLKHGEIANRIVSGISASACLSAPNNLHFPEQITVGDPKRARTVASHFDKSPRPFEVLSERGFLTITGRFNGVPVSVIAIGMGGPNMDFFVREARECLVGEMVIIRYGSCGGLTDIPVGSLVIPESCVAITRNWDFDFTAPEHETDAKDAYIISKPVSGDHVLHAKLVEVVTKAAAAVHAAGGIQTPVHSNVVNAAADSFYSSQGRRTTFPDHNSGLIDRLLFEVPRLATLEARLIIGLAE
ncbi:Enoyl-(Acyl carrier protein) reductase [Ceratobasidium sp. AG-Ba]|nr:Enoyl-(Acyl carrier protein) reductase [Ceratobasidium sp. AG-Ba]QRV91807.1 Enoyl-(Acyl carrier protein) reductase [Ceratobasidium sp. AG-Ba]